jgi:hypothetical protein
MGGLGDASFFYESDKEEAEKEAQKFREGRYLEDLIYQGFKVYVEEVVD